MMYPKKEFLVTGLFQEEEETSGDACLHISEPGKKQGALGAIAVHAPNILQ
jgi:hypothetical protein